MGKTKVSGDVIEPHTIHLIDVNKVKFGTFEEAIQIAERISKWMEEGALTVEGFQRAYQLGSRALGHAKRALQSLTLTMEVVEDRETALQAFVIEQAQALLTSLTDCVREKSVDQVALNIQRFGETILSRCAEEMER